MAEIMYASCVYNTLKHSRWRRNGGKRQSSETRLQKRRRNISENQHQKRKRDVASVAAVRRKQWRKGARCRRGLFCYVSYGGAMPQWRKWR